MHALVSRNMSEDQMERTRIRCLPIYNSTLLSSVLHSISLAAAVAYSPRASGRDDANLTVQKGWQHGSSGSQGDALCCEDVVVWSPAQCNRHMMMRRHLKVAEVVWTDLRKYNYGGFCCIAGMMPKAS